MPLALRESRFLPMTQIVRQRLLPGSGEVLVHVGDRVQPDDIVAEAPTDGRLAVIDLAQELGISVSHAYRFLRSSVGTEIDAGDLLAIRKPVLRRRRLVEAPFAGVVQAVEDGYVFLRQKPQTLKLRAYIPGRIVEHYPLRGVAVSVSGALVRGIWGSGGEIQGLLAMMVSEPDQVLTWERVGLRYRGSILVGGILEDPRVLLRARQFRLAGLVVGGMLPGLRSLCEQLRLPVVVTEGMGHIPMAGPVFDLLHSCHGRPAVLCGSTAQAETAPELIVPIPGKVSDASNALAIVRPIEMSSRVRLTRAPYIGMVGEVVALPSTPQQTPIGTYAEGAMVRLPEGRRVFIPFVNLEPLD